MGERLAGKVAVITGGGNGIGRACAVRFAEEGADILVADIQEDPGAETVGLVKETGREALFVRVDAQSQTDNETMAATAIERFGKIDVLVNNAGRGFSRLPSQITDEDIDDMMLVNVKSVMYGVQAVLPHFIERGSGHVINISSMLGRIPYAVIRSAYCGAKFFLDALTITFRAEVQQTHPKIQFSLVSPGVVRTDFGLNALHGGPDSRTLPDSQGVEEVAQVIARVIETREPDVYTRRGAAHRVASYYASLGADPILQ